MVVPPVNPEQTKPVEENAILKATADKENIYINTSASIDGALVKIGSLYYRVISGDNGENYLLEKIELNNPKIEIVEVKK